MKPIRCTREALDPNDQAAHHDAHAEHLRRRDLQHRDDQGPAGRPGSTRCTSTRPGCRTPSSTSSTATMHAMGKGAASEGGAGLRHAVHAQAAGRAVAGVAVLVQDSQNSTFDKHLFNEAYLMHTSTSPQYAIIASCDVAAAMMEPPGGTALVERAIEGSARFPPRDAQGRRRVRRRLVVQGLGPREALAEEGIGDREDWVLRPNDRWHGFGNAGAGLQHARSDQGDHHHAGPRRGRRVRRDRHSAAIVTKYLAEHGIIVEKTGCIRSSSCSRSASRRAAGIRWSPSCSSSRTTTTTTSLCGGSCRSSCALHPSYERMGLRDLCEQIHSVYRATISRG
jgi:arginine decarboxylase